MPDRPTPVSVHEVKDTIVEMSTHYIKMLWLHLDSEKAIAALEAAEYAAGYASVLWGKQQLLRIEVERQLINVASEAFELRWRIKELEAENRQLKEKMGLPPTSGENPDK